MKEILQIKGNSIKIGYKLIILRKFQNKCRTSKQLLPLEVKTTVVLARAQTRWLFFNVLFPNQMFEVVNKINQPKLKSSKIFLS